MSMTFNSSVNRFESSGRLFLTYPAYKAFIYIPSNDMIYQIIHLIVGDLDANKTHCLYCYCNFDTMSPHYIDHQGATNVYWSYGVSLTGNNDATRAMNTIFGTGKWEVYSYDQAIKWLLEKKTSFHTDTVYVDKTKVNYTDGTYSIKDGALDATSARSEGYKYLLNTYGTFYRGTEEELSNSFATGLDSL